jgi:NADP-dependent 3-hydroxy acid dehydrogenase YdfG
MNLHERLKGKVIVICGGGAGTGKASALRFAAEGAKVVVGGRRMEKLEAVVGEIRENGGDAAPFEFDMNDYAGIDDLIAFAEATFGRIDGLHNIAGNPVAGEAVKRNCKETLIVNTIIF